jgi:aspartate beta-hydroxylase
MGTYPGLTSRPWHDAERFALARELERAVPQIAAELHGLSAGAFHAEAEPISRTGSWDVFLLYERGKRNQENCARCPVTTRIVESHRTVRAPGGLIYFSRLAPKTRVAPHAGPTNLRLRLHLGLDIPPNCALRVGGESRSWQPGRCVVFDDSFEHEVWNDSDHERTVLVVDLWHPDLSDDEVALLDGLGRYAFAHARNLAGFWAANEAARRQTVR